MDYAVIGSAYGDEGKGLFTDYLASLHDSHIVRFNGGAQAGHTVTTTSLRHEFGSLGSGSFLNKPTHLSSYFIFNPLVFEKEKIRFDSLGFNSVVNVNEEAYLSTPFDMIMNQLVEIKRGANQHGSCGLGIGETIQRCENKKYATHVKMLQDREYLLQMLQLVQSQYLPIRIEELGVSKLVEKDFSFIFQSQFTEKIIYDYLRIKEKINIVKDILPKETLIFEGAQGLLLDQDLGYFPHVTRSNTGLKNIVELMLKSKREELEIIYTTRCYTTRHGAGPLANALPDMPYERIVDKTNTPNQFQGSLRFAYLDIDLLQETIKRDIAHSKIEGQLKFNYKIGLSCLDQTDTVKFYENKQLNELPSEKFCEHLRNKFKVEVLESWGPTRATIKATKSF